ncbi:bifunctional diaminohydroxyphosphoribosylaminopyrimidine deaminase/5-amino-6-(5-phosphoribosylamino)uracil reductase RibD [Pedobacter sp. JY14-1]|uniref:bifunctional diaminohydroxyphosphoribosylaminopyrimidine deaminase/5-amino-6-(5-phosphoribosylamino)uracil reductase RibD n=1 Tax=Pedobacter sp. JY14-1 TaxID=3034151 RepID=UPI0023E14FE2|nr:bifunctional diaminohydroxyphosphoribosylaminopyrimidine deaminase/5-amino-6-(5-phosphoribosylamino)uracil reductase RibD [Pedobacter sp. JY14-1]
MMTDERYMQRCLELAGLGMANVSPNPMVGCVIVHNDQVIGEGYHARFGGPHAEVNAVNSVLEKYGPGAEPLLREATVYVNLEPCAHFGKTPPCADMLVRHQVKRVVVGNTDPFSEVNGKGIERLRAAGIEVDTGVLLDKCSYLNRRFFTRITRQRPYIILKWATTANGYFAPKNTTQEWISGPLARKLVHKWRTEEDAILIGKRTAISDNPLLTSREWSGKNPIRILIDRQLRVPSTSQIFNDEARTIILNEVRTRTEANIQYIQMEDMQHYLPQKVAFQLYLMDIQSVIIEGGSNTLMQFIDAGLWDEARVFTSAKSWKDGLPAPQINGEVIEETAVQQDRLTVYQNTYS